MHFQTRPVLNINMFIISLSSNSIFLVPWPSIDFTDDIISTRTHTFWVYSAIYIIHIGLAIIWDYLWSKFRISIFWRFSEYFGVCELLMWIILMLTAFSVGHIKV